MGMHMHAYNSRIINTYDKYYTHVHFDATDTHLPLSVPRHRLAVADLHASHGHGHVMLSLQPIARYVQVQLSHAAQQQLARVFVRGDVQRRVLAGHD